MQRPIIVSVDGNLAVGKSTLLAEIQRLVDPSEILVCAEPVAEWTTMCDADGRSLLELFYADMSRWSYTFQNCAILTRLLATHKALKSAAKIIITERSVLTDRHVFAEMLHNDGLLSEIEWTLYLKWFEEWALPLPVAGIVWLTAPVATDHERLVLRDRKGEEGITVGYLEKLEAQHEAWLGGDGSRAGVPVLRLESVSDVPAMARQVIDFARGLQPGCRLEGPSVPDQELPGTSSTYTKFGTRLD
jgi:deoxyadenosine/deoxycytidine kinase